MIFDISSEAAGSSRRNYLPNPGRSPVPRAVDGARLLRQLQPILAGLAFRLANGDSPLRDDMSQEGAFAGLIAIGRFEPSKGSLPCYAARCARGAMLHHRRWLRKFRREIPAGWDAPHDGADDILSRPTLLETRDDSAAGRLFGALDATLLRQLAAAVLIGRPMQRWRSARLLQANELQIPSRMAKSGRATSTTKSYGRRNCIHSMGELRE